MSANELTAVPEGGAVVRMRIGTGVRTRTAANRRQA